MNKSVVISLGDSRLKDMAEVLGSKSCVDILDLLGNEDLTVSDLSEKLGMKLNTVDYNVKKLVKAGLIEKADHWWSVKGRKMIVYRVVDKQVVISPRKKIAAEFLWVFGLTGVVGLLLRGFTGTSESLNAEQVRDATFAAAPVAEDFAAQGTVGTVASGVRESVNAVAGDVSFWASLAGWEWFLIGAWGSIVLFFVYSMIVGRR